MRRALALVWSSTRRWTVLWAVVLVVQGVLPALTVYVSKVLIDGLVVAAGQGVAWAVIEPLLGPGVAMALLLLAAHVLGSTARWIRTGLSETFRDHLRSLVHGQAVSLDLAHYESSAYHDRMHRVMGEVSHRPIVMLESLGSVAQSAITILGMAALIVVYAWWLPLVLVVGAVPALVVALRFSRRRHAWWMRRTQDERWTNYYETLMTHSSVAAEIRLFRLGDHFRELYQALRMRLRNERIDLERRHIVESVAAGMVALIVTAAIMAWITLRALRGLATIGDIALFYQAFSRGQNLMRTLLVGTGQVYDSSLFVSELFDFLSLRPMAVLTTGDPLDGRPEEVRFEKVSFTYPGSEQTVLNDIDVTFRRGRTVAIVGENGAGKSTLLKLLCRFYDPQGGCIYVDGRPMTTVRPQDVWSMSTVLFQFPVQYHASARDNIVYGDIRATPNDTAVERAATLAGIRDRIARLPDGYETLLGRWFVDGEELSGGEWQRLAMARAFYRDAPVVILDEPTSMLDSWAESEWFERFRELVADRIGIVITHRFTIARRADVIHVMKHGRIVESGSHDELLLLDGLYASSWSEQVASAG